jgi:hypothetical protein
MRRALVLMTLALLAGCGSRGPLRPAPGVEAPRGPAGAVTPPTADQLMQPSVEARPDRSDEPLLQSEERQEDRFDLPPPG